MYIMLLSRIGTSRTKAYEASQVKKTLFFMVRIFFKNNKISLQESYLLPGEAVKKIISQSSPGI